MNNFKQTIALFLIILIFGSGLAIYVWNLLHGRNLAESPQFDLSAYDDMSAFDSVRENLLEKQFEQPAPPVEIDEVSSDDSETSGTENSQLDKGNIYFKSSFRLATAEETNDLIASFLQDFPGFELAKIENLEALNQIEIELPALGREDIIKQLEENEVIEKVAVVEPPVWEVTFTKGLYNQAIVDLLAPYNGVVIKSLLPEEKEYIASVNFNELQVSDETLTKLGSEYSDVLTIIQP